MSAQWRQGEIEDNEEIERSREAGELEYWTCWVSRCTINRPDRDTEDLLDMLIMKEENYEHFLSEKKGIGPERRQVEKYESSARDTLYADDGSGRESGKTVGELKVKTERMLRQSF
jgi:hypothetical protein